MATFAETIERTNRPPEIEGVAAAALCRDADIVEDRKVRKDRGNLKGTDETATCQVRGPRLGHVDAFIEDGPFRRLQELREQIETSRLACAVRPDQRVNRPAPNAQVNLIDRGKSGKRLAQAARLENDVSRIPAPAPHVSSSYALWAIANVIFIVLSMAKRPYRVNVNRCAARTVRTNGSSESSAVTYHRRNRRRSLSSWENKLDEHYCHRRRRDWMPHRSPAARTRAWRHAARRRAQHGGRGLDHQR